MRKTATQTVGGILREHPQSQPCKDNKRSLLKGNILYHFNFFCFLGGAPPAAAGQSTVRITPSMALDSISVHL